MGHGWQHPKISLVQLSFGLTSKPQYMLFEIGILLMYLFFLADTTFNLTLLHCFTMVFLIIYEYLESKK